MWLNLQSIPHEWTEAQISDVMRVQICFKKIDYLFTRHEREFMGFLDEIIQNLNRIPNEITV